MAPKKNKNQNISESDKESESLPEKETSIRKQKSSLKKRNRNEAFNSRSDSDSDFEEPQEAEGEYHSRLTSALEDSELSILQFLTKEKLRKDKKGLNPVEIKIQVMKVFGALKIEIAERSKNLGKVYKTWRKKQIGSFYALKKGNKRLKLLPSTGVDGTFHQSNPELLIPEISVSTAEKQNENLDCIPSETADNISKEKKHASVMEISAEEEFTLKGKSTSGSEKVACRSERSFDLSEENSEKFGFSDFDDIEVEDRLTSDTEVEFEKNLRAIELEFENSRKNSPQLGENLSKDFVNSQVLDNNLPRNSNKDSPRVSEKNSSGIIGKNSILSQSNSPRVSETRSPRVSKNNSPRISEKNSTPISERNSLPISERSSPPISEKSSPPISEKSSRTISERNSSPISENNSLLISEKSSPPISEKNSTPISEKNFDDESEKERSITKSPALDSQESKISEEFLLPCDQIEKNSRKSDESQSMKSAENDSNAYLDDLIRRNLEEESDEDFRDVDLEAEQGKRKDREEKNGTDKKEKDKSPKEDLLSQKDHSNFSKRHEDFESEELEITNFIFNMDKDSDCEMKSYFEKNLRSKTAEDKLSGSISSKEKSPAKIIEEKSVEGKTTANEISEEKSAEEISEEMIAHRGKEMENSEEKISESIDKGKEIENLEEKIFEKVDEGKEIANSEQNISEEMIADKGKESKNSEQNIFEGMIVDKPNKIENSEENLDMENSEIKNAEEKLKIENSENSKVRSPVWKEKGLEAVNSELIRNEIDSVPKKSAREENPDVPSSVSKQMKEKSPEVSSSELISNGIDSIPKETAREKSPEIDNSELITNKIDSMPIETEEEKSPKVQSPISKEKSPVVPNSELIANEDDSVWKDEDSESREEIGVTEASNKEKNQKTECKSPTIENSPQKKSEESKKEATELNSSILARLKNICDSSSDSENSPVSKITRKHADESSPEKKNFKTHSPSLTQGSRKKKFKRLLTPGSQKQISRSSVNSQEINEKKIRESELAVDKEEDLNLIAKEDILKSSEPSDSSTDSDSNDSDKSGKSTSTKSSSEKEVKKRRYEKLVRSSDSETSRFKSRRKKQRTSKEKDDSIKEYRLAERKQEINQDNIIDISLANLERRRKQFSPNTSSDEEDTNVKDVRKTLFRNRKSLLKKRDESLLDHLENVENGTANYEPMEDLPPAMEVDSERGKIMTNQELFAEADISAKKILLNSSGPDSDDEVLTDDKSDNVENRSANKKSDSEKCNHARENKLKAKRSKGKIDQASELISEDGTDLVTDDTDSDVNNILTDDKNTSESEEEVGRRSVDKFHRIPKDDSTWETKELEDFKKKLEDETTQKASEEETKRLKRLKKRRLRRMILSETEIELSEESKDVEKDSDSNTDNFKKKKKERSWFDLKRFVKKKKSKNRKRLKNVDNSRHELERVNSNGLATAGRKNIRKVLTDRELDEETRRADKKEKERLKRIAEREKLFEEERQIIQNKKGNKLVLDIDERTKEELITVHKDLVKYLKPHQAQGVKFMWDACFESLERMKTSSGSGCILAHCMGLGKTFQVVTLSHTLLTHKQSGIKTILVVVPLSTASNWYSEYQMWLRDVNKGNDFAVYEMKRQTRERKFLLETWQKTGGVMIIGYEMYRNLTKPYNKKIDERTQNVMMNCFVDPGPDLIVCDEAHLLKNENSATSIAIKKVRTCRRIALTGTPLQNNLKEYHCMVQFIKPNLLGSKTEFMNRFGNPIDNGQYEDSDPSDVRLMKNRAFVLLEKLKGCVQRFDYTVLTPFLPPKQEYVIYVRLSEVQIQMYQYYLDHFVSEYGGRRLFADFQALQRVMTHPRVVQMYDEIMEKKQNQNQKRLKRKGKSKKTPKPLGEEDADLNDDDSELKEDPRLKGNFDWWKNVVKEADLQNLNVSSKLQLLFGILNECEKTGEKLLVFSKGLLILDIVEEFLEKINKATKKQTSNENLGGHKGRWKLGKDYFRMDGKVNMDLRSAWCNEFNKQSNKRARLFLISTRAGSLGINLTAANRVIIFDASWNPSHDLQAIFRIYRFGQRKPCYVYRFIALGTMEERIYNRQITKLSLAGRVIDEKQIERHYKRRDLAELYRLEPKGENPRQDMLNPPKDRLLAEIFSKYGELVERYLEHDSLLANKEDEVLDEEDRKRAWVEYEDEKSGKKMFQVKQEIDESYLSQVYNPTDLGETTNELDRIPSPVASLSRASSTNDVGSLSSSNSHYSDAEDVGANDTSSISSAKTAKVPYITKSPPKSREVTESLEPISSFLKRLEI